MGLQEQGICYTLSGRFLGGEIYQSELTLVLRRQGELNSTGKGTGMAERARLSVGRADMDASYAKGK